MPLTAAQQSLAVSGIPRACNLSKVEEHQFPPLREEFRSGAMMALVQAAGTYEEEMGTSFSTWLTSRVHFEFREVKRQAAPKGYRRDPANAPKMYTMSQSPESVDDGVVLLVRPLPDVGRGLEDRELIDWLLAEVSEECEAICRRVIMGGETREQVAYDLGLHPVAVARMIHESLAQMREALESA